MKSRKTGIDDLIHRAEIDRHREQTYQCQGRRESGEMNWEIGIDVYTLLSLSIK